MKRSIPLIICILFILFAILQFNDPDPLIWILVYGYVAALSLLVYLGKEHKWFSLTGGLACIAGAAFFVPDIIAWVNEGMPSIVESMKANGYVEPVREFGGLILAGAVCLWYYFKSGNPVTSS